MNEMNILTLNGERYEVADKVARESVAAANQEIAKKAEINDNVIDDMAAWSSNKIVETVCPPFEVTGPVVTCNPVVGYPLTVKSEIAPTAEITAWNEAKLTRCGSNLAFNAKSNSSGDDYTLIIHFQNDAPTITFPIGTYISVELEADNDTSAYWNSNCGLFTSAITFKVEKGKHKYRIRTTKEGKLVYWQPMLSKSATGDGVVITPTNLQMSVEEEPYEPYTGETFTATFPEPVYGGEVDWISGKVKSTLSSDGSELPEPKTLDITPVIPAGKSGVNTFYTDTGDTTVSGRTDPLAVIANQQAQIDELKKAIVSTGGNV